MTTRRLIIGGGAAALAAPVSFAGTTPAATDPAEAIFMTWLAGCSRWNSWRTGDPEIEDVKQRTIEAERVLCSRLEPSPMAVAVLTLNQMCYDLDWSKPGEGEDDERPTVRDLAEGRGHDARFPFSVLRCLRPSLTGRVAYLVADLLDNPDRPPADSLVFRAYLGEVTL